MIKMRELLLNQYRADLLSVGMDSCRNFEHLLEATIQQCIVKVGCFAYCDILLHNRSLMKGSKCQVMQFMSARTLHLMFHWHKLQCIIKVMGTCCAYVKASSV